MKVVRWVLTPLFWFGVLALILSFHVLFLITIRINRKLYRRTVEIGNLGLVLNLRTAGTSVKVHFESALPEDRSIIFVSNHQSMFDIPLLLWELRKYRPHFISKKELGRGIPSISHALRNLGSCLIDRKQRHRAVHSIAEFGNSLRGTNEGVVIFPEGTRARKGIMGSFKEAGVRALLESFPEALVVPVAISGMWQVTQDNMLPVGIGAKVRLWVGSPREIDRNKLEEAIPALETEVRSLLEKNSSIS